MSRFYVGIDIGGSSIKAAVVSDKGEITREAKTETQSDKGPAIIKGNIAKAIREILKQAEQNTENVAAIGIGSAGIVDNRGNVIDPPQFPGWGSQNIAHLAEETSGLPSWAENDANVAAIGEATFGAGTSYSDFVLMTLGTGVGGGIVLNGELYKGTGFAAGEIGHILVFPNGKHCNCGANGCLERYAGIAGIVERAAELLAAAPSSSLLRRQKEAGQALSPLLIHEAAMQGDEIAKTVLRETGEILGYAATTMFNILNMQAIVVAGGISDAGDFILAPMRSVIKRNACRSPLMELAVVPATLGSKTGVIGAAALAIRELRRRERS